jgi:hypothetical protein
MPKYEDNADKPVVVQSKKQDYTYIAIESLMSAHLKYTGLVTGKQYEWPKAGDVVSVDERDVPNLLSKRVGTHDCCGASPDGNHVFQLYQAA